MTAVNPFNGKSVTYSSKICPSALPFLLHWAGVQLKSLSLTTKLCYERDGSRLNTIRGMFEALTSEAACPNLVNLKVESCRLACNDEIVFGDLLKYVTKRQLEAVSNSHPRPFLRSLSLSNTPYCENDYGKPSRNSLRRYVELQLLFCTRQYSGGFQRRHA